MSSAAIQAAVAEQLLALPAGAKPHLGDIRRAIGCSPAELAAAIQALRYQGKLHWERLELSPSMLAPQSDTLRGPELVANADRPRPVDEPAGSPVPAAEGEAAVESGTDASSSGPDEIPGGASGTAREASSASSLGDATRDKVRAPNATAGGATATPVADGPEGLDEGPGRNAARAPSGPDDDDDYPGEVNDEAPQVEEAEQGPARDGPLPGEGADGDLPLPLRQDQPALPGGRVEEPRPDAANDQPAGPVERSAPAAARTAASPQVRAGRHAAMTRGGRRPVPMPRHETEVERLVREECNEAASRRSRAVSTATVRQPLELKKFGVPDMSLSEAISSMLSDDPQSIMRAVSRKHPEMWRRCILLGRAIGKSPMVTLYDALAAGLEGLEAKSNIGEARDAA